MGSLSELLREFKILVSTTNSRDHRFVSVVADELSDRLSVVQLSTNWHTSFESVIRYSPLYLFMIVVPSFERWITVSD
jgi:hypothetical protein